MKNKEDCIDCLKVYYGIPPYDKHTSRSSGSFYHYVKEKYGKKLVIECEKELKIDKPSVPNCS